MKSNIVLIGFMGSGKSSVGKILSQLMNKNFLDMDEYIQQNSKMTIQEIFHDLGESFFRAKEHHLVKELDSESNLVIATGGGVVLDQRNMDLLSKRGIIVYLKCDFDTIVQRIKTENNRPLFTLENLAEFEHVFASRIHLYEESAHFTIDVKGKSIELIATEIAQVLKKKSYRDEITPFIFIGRTSILDTSEEVI